jgi:hypothetical protein
VRVQAQDRKDRERVWQAICASYLDFGPWIKHDTSRVAEGDRPAARKIVLTYELLHKNPRVQTLLSPYYNARFAPPWAGTFPDISITVSWLIAWARFFRQFTIRKQEYDDFWHPTPGLRGWFRQKFCSGPVWTNDLTAEHFDLDLLDGFEQFVTQYQEGAVVVLVLLMTLYDPKRWRPELQTHGDGFWMERYLSMLDLPTLVNREPLEIFLLLGRLDELLSLNAQLFRHAVKKLEERGKTHFINLPPPKDMLLLSALLVQSRAERVRQRWWITSEKLVRTYLLARACDIAYFSQKVADKTFPQPTLPGVPSAQIADMIVFMVQLLQEEEERRKNQAEQGWLAKCDQEIQAEWAKALIYWRQPNNHNSPAPLPASLPARVLSGNEIEALKAACRKELGLGEK